MVRYTVILKSSVEKDLKKIPDRLLPALLSRIGDLQDDPLPRDAVKLSGADHFYRIRVGDYRIVYQVLHDALEITVYYIRHRSTVYRGL